MGSARARSRTVPAMPRPDPLPPCRKPSLFLPRRQPARYTPARQPSRKNVMTTGSTSRNLPDLPKAPLAGFEGAGSCGMFGEDGRILPAPVRPAQERRDARQVIEGNRGSGANPCLSCAG